MDGGLQPKIISNGDMPVEWCLEVQYTNIST